jgi:digeranylgeranylglycerophospholipid reductase
MKNYDIVIIGASFAGLTLAHHLPRNLKVLVLDMKASMDHHIESTGLVTQATYDLLAGFMDVTPFIPNKINSIGVIGTDYKRHFFSFTDEPWIYSTDTPALVKQMADDLPENVDLKLRACFKSYKVDTSNEAAAFPVSVEYSGGGKSQRVGARFLVGADGAISSVAKANPALSQNKKFLVGIEKVFYGNITFGPNPDQAVYHYWFGEFSLGYGGWISPTTMNGKPAFRVGLAKKKKDAKELRKVDKFISILEKKGMIELHDKKPTLTFSSMIPIGGPVKRVADEHTMIIGDAAGLCGAFAADGIKGAIVSGQIAAKLIPRHLKGEKGALKSFHKEVQAHNKLMTYYWKQVFYRFVWDRMKSDRSFNLMFALVERAKENFLGQFCDSKDKHKSLMWIVLRVKNIPLLVKYALSLVGDLLKRGW